MHKKLILALCATGLIISSRDSTAAADSKLAAVHKQKSTMPFDFTSLSYDVQKIVLGYLGSGWQIARKANYGADQKLLQYHDGVLCLQKYSANCPEIAAVLFGHDFYWQGCETEQDIELNKKLNINDRFHSIYRFPNKYRFYSPNYWAEQEHQRIRFYFNHEGRHRELPIVSAITIPNQTARGAVPPVCALRFSTCEKYCVVSAGYEPGPVITLWDLKTGKLMQTFESDKQVCSVAISDDIKYVLAGLRDNSIILYEVDSKMKTIIKNNNIEKDITGKDIPNSELGVTAVAMSPDGKYIASGTNFGHIFEWEYQPDLRKLE